MTREWIEPIYDRTYGNVLSVQQNPDQINPKGCWNDTDLTRIEKNTAYCLEWMIEQKIIRTEQHLEIHEEDGYWVKNTIPTKTQIDRVINNVRTLIEISKHNPVIADQLPTIYASTQVNYVLANQIEFALELMHSQPKLPLEYFNVTIVNGVITTILRDDGHTEVVNESQALVAEDEIVTIRGMEYGEYAQYQTFAYWSSNAEDLGLLIPDSETQEVHFKMPYRELSFTANFETHILRTLKINGGYISVSGNPREESGPNTGTYYAGDQIMIIANRATDGKVFYEWTGTEEALENILGVTDVEDPSTAILTMPEADVTLTPKYINAGMHNVTVNGGSGSGAYNYKDYVSISANVPSHYEFAYWSGNTSYLTDIYSAYQSFEMGDVNISFTAHFNYVYSRNDVQVINGKIRINGNEVNKATQLLEASSQTLVPTPPNSSQGLDYWSIEGAGSIRTDDVDNHTNTFVVGDGNAIITGHYNTLRTLAVENINNNGSSTTYNIVQGHKIRLSTNEVSGNYMFVNWSMNGSQLSTSTSFTYTVPNDNKVIRANYRLKNQVQITINYGTHSEVITMTERSSRSITADAAPAGKHFVRWDYSNLYTVNNRYSTITSFTAGSGNGSITAIYENDYNYYNLKVNGGTGSGDVREGGSTTIDATQAPATYEFDYWEINSGVGASIANIYTKRTTFYMGTSDAVITAHYKPIPRFNVRVIDGYVKNDNGEWVESASLLRNASNAIKIKNAPTGYRFLQWEIYVNGVLQTDANDVLLPYAETTTLRNLLRDITIKATYYVPDPTIMYTLIIERKTGEKEQYNYPAGTDVPIYASYPDEGKVFYRWEGDIAYVAGGIYKSESYVHMPAQNIEIRERFEDEGFIPKFELTMTNPQYGECCYETEYTNPETGETTITETWVKKYLYPEGTEVKIRVTDIDPEEYFSQWNAINHDTSEDARSIIKELNKPITTLIIPDYPVDCEPVIPLKTTYELRVTNGYTGGRESALYYEGARADVYFGKVSTDDIHYDFTRWTGASGTDITKIQLWDGGMFDVSNPGTAEEPIYIKMPGKATELIGNYTTSYKLELTGATIDGTEEESVGYYPAGTIKNITANPPAEGMKFQYWEGDTDRLGSKYDPTTTIEISTLPTRLTVVYSTDEDQNSIGFVNSSLDETTTVNNSDIHVIAGKIEIGFILTDIKGHIYVVTGVNSELGTCSIYRMTKIYMGGNLYG